MQPTGPVRRIDVRHAITPLSLLTVGAALPDLEPEGTVEVLCDDPALADDLGRVFHDWTCVRVRCGGETGDRCCVLTLRKNSST